MLLTERKTVPKGAGWLAEIKFDGYRALASTGSGLSVRTKNGADCTAWFPELRPALASLPGGCVVDGEICVLDDLGRPDFERVHARARHRRWYDGADPVVYCVFDLLALQGRDVRQLPVEERKAALEHLLNWSIGKGNSTGMLYVQALLDQAEWLYSQALSLQLEGIVCKRAGTTYQDGVRSSDWIKVKRPGAVPPERFKR
jgi:bifunctional non-homologous end joining protein LigD